MKKKKLLEWSLDQARSREIFERLGWEPIEKILKKREITMTFQAIQDELPEYMSEMFKFNHNDMYHVKGCQWLQWTLMHKKFQNLN
jgi:hypothetical protein